MIHYQLIGAVRDPYISKYEVEIRRERLEAIKEEMILSCSEIKHHSYKTTNGFVSCDNRITNFHTSKIRTSEENNGLEEYLVEYDEIIYPYEVKLIEKVLKEGYRTTDIMSEGKTLVGTREMGDLIVSHL